jgi:hypothetical protein
MPRQPAIAVPVLAALVAVLAIAPARAATGYKCVDADGRVSFQDTPCADAARGDAFFYPDAQPAAPAAEAEPPPAPDAAPLGAPAAPEPGAARAAPEFYLCTRFDGEQYYSDDGATAPYTAPAGVAGYPDNSLSRAYGSRGRLGVSAPELSRPGIATPGTRADLAAGYIWVQDQCRRLGPRAACRAIRAEHDTAAAAAQRGFREDRAPLQARAAALAKKLEGC